jgi:hypothetical protein
MRTTANLMVLDDRCHRAGWRSVQGRSLPRGAWDVLREAIAYGLGAPENRPETAAFAVREAALNNQLEVEPPNAVYAISEHLAAIAEQVVYVVGGDAPWERPEPIMLDYDLWWDSKVFRSGTDLKRVVLTDYWSDRRMAGEGMSWHEAGEQAVYGGSLTEIIVLLGAHRENRFHGLWSKGWKHPQNGEIRLQSASGGEFKRYIPFYRDDAHIDYKHWAELMPTGLALTVQVKEPMQNAQRRAWKALAMRKMDSMRAKEEPLPQLSQCNFPSRCPCGPCTP